jgi:hypothetical protein
VHLGVKHTFTNGGECKGWSLMTPKCTPHFGSCTHVRVANVHNFGCNGKQTPNWAPKIPLERFGSVDA